MATSRQPSNSAVCGSVLEMVCTLLCLCCVVCISLPVYCTQLACTLLRLSHAVQKMTWTGRTTLASLWADDRWKTRKHMLLSSHVVHNMSCTMSQKSCALCKCCTCMSFCLYIYRSAARAMYAIPSPVSGFPHTAAAVCILLLSLANGLVLMDNIMLDQDPLCAAALL